MKKDFFIRFFLAVFSKLLPKLGDFKSSDDFIGKFTSISIRIYPVSVLKNIWSWWKNVLFLVKWVTFADIVTTQTHVNTVAGQEQGGLILSYLCYLMKKGITSLRKVS